MMPNRISRSLDLVGPSVAVDSACSSSLYALNAAITAMRSGECDAAIVGSANLMLHPNVMMHFTLLGALANDGICRPFDDKSNGYARADAVCALYLQRATHAKRIYAHVVHTKTNCDGFKLESESNSQWFFCFWPTVFFFFI